MLLLALLNFFVGVFRQAAAAAGRRAHRREPLQSRCATRCRRGWSRPRCRRWTARLLPLTYFVILVGGAVSLVDAGGGHRQPDPARVTGAGERGRATGPLKGTDGHRPLGPPIFRHRRGAGRRPAPPATPADPPAHWNAFFLAADRDPLLEEGAARLRAAQAEHEVVYLTGRPERNRALTGPGWPGAAPYRPAAHAPGRRLRPARWVKRTHALRPKLARTRTIASVLDDDPAVVAVLCADGWPVELYLAAAFVDPAERPGAAGTDMSRVSQRGDPARGYWSRERAWRANN